MTSEKPIHNPQDLAWGYLREFYYPRFRNSIGLIPWEKRYGILKDLYDNREEDTRWEERSGDPIRDMMEWVGRKGYWTFFLRGVDVMPDGSFKVHIYISQLLGRLGALGNNEDPISGDEDE